MTLKILLVDDNLTFLTSVKMSLAMLPNAQVIAEAHDGPHALELAQRLSPDLVLMDIVMPGMTGLEVAKVMQSWPTTPKILFLSMHDNDSYRTAADALGALGLIGKANLVTDLLPVIAALAAPAVEAAP